MARRLLSPILPPERPAAELILKALFTNSRFGASISGNGAAAAAPAANADALQEPRDCLSGELPGVVYARLLEMVCAGINNWG